MKGTDADFHEILDSKIQFRIPVFQRDYLWEEPHCAKLFRDILRIGAVEGVVVEVDQLTEMSIHADQDPARAARELQEWPVSR